MNKNKLYLIVYKYPGKNSLAIRNQDTPITNSSIYYTFRCTNFTFGFVGYTSLKDRPKELCYVHTNDL